jgi:hypothetical protein
MNLKAKNMEDARRQKFDLYNIIGTVRWRCTMVFLGEEFGW